MTRKELAEQLYKDFRQLLLVDFLNEGPLTGMSAESKYQDCASWGSPEVLKLYTHTEWRAEWRLHNMKGTIQGTSRGDWSEQLIDFLINLTYDQQEEQVLLLRTPANKVRSRRSNARRASTSRDRRPHRTKGAKR